MQQSFDYLENVNFAATVCDTHGIVLYQNAQARRRDGNVVGKNLYECHSKESQEAIRRMITTGKSNTYEVIRHGKRRLLHQTPWFSNPGGDVSGLIEISIELPDALPSFNRGEQQST